MMNMIMALGPQEQWRTTSRPMSRWQRGAAAPGVIPTILLLLLLLSQCSVNSAFSPLSNAYRETKYCYRIASDKSQQQLLQQQQHLQSTVLWRQPSKWDLILDDLDDDEEDDKDTGKGPRQYTPCPPDMMYEPRIVQRAHQTFFAIREAGGPEATNDVYVRDPVDKQVFWYTGKVARVSDVSLEECIHRLYPMIERHACHLRPLELYPHRGDGALEVWVAPGDSEMDVAYNRPTIKLQKFVHSAEWQYSKKNKTKYPSRVKAAMVGFQGEVYQDGEDGFRTWRNDDGLPARPEISVSGPPITTPEELEQLQKRQFQKQESSSSDNDDDIIDAVVSQKDTTSTGSDNKSATP